MDKKITELSAYSSPIATDLLAIVDITSVVTKKITLADLTSFFGFWALDGNTNGAEKSFGNVDNFNIPFIINNEQVGKWIRVNSSIMGLDLGVSNTRAGNLQLHTTVSATPWLSADESNGVKIRDFYTLGLAGNLIALNVYNNMAAAIYAATAANSQVAIITNKSIGIGHITSSTYTNADAVDGNVLHLGDTNLSIRNAVTQPTTPYIDGVLFFAKDRTGAGTSSPYALTENGTLIDFVGLTLGGGFTLVNGSGTTAVTDHVDLGGLLTSNAVIDGDAGTYGVTLENLSDFLVETTGDAEFNPAGFFYLNIGNDQFKIKSLAPDDAQTQIMVWDSTAMLVKWRDYASLDFLVPNLNLSDLTDAGDARLALGATTVGSNLFTLADPSAITFIRINADNTVSALDATTFRTAIGAGTGSGTVTSVSGTANRISSSGGATPVIDIDAAYVGQTSITTLGTIATGTWQATVLNSTYGGTGINNGGRTLAIATNGGSIAFSSPALALTVAGNASITGTNTGDVTLAGQNYLSIAGQVITANAITLSGTHVTGVLPIANGGTAKSTIAANKFWYASATDTLSETDFQDVAEQTYGGSAPVWTAGTSPSGATTHVYTWFRIGKQICLKIWLKYAVAGATCTQVVFDLPADCPTPREPSGLGAANDKLYMGVGYMDTALTGTPAAARALLKNKATGTYEIMISAASNNSICAHASVWYEAA